jgi:hypothetical protein
LCFDRKIPEVSADMKLCNGIKDGCAMEWIKEQWMVEWKSNGFGLLR